MAYAISHPSQENSTADCFRASPAGYATLLAFFCWRARPAGPPDQAALEMQKITHTDFTINKRRDLGDQESTRCNKSGCYQLSSSIESL